MTERYHWAKIRSYIEVMGNWLTGLFADGQLTAVFIIDSSPVSKPADRYFHKLTKPDSS